MNNVKQNKLIYWLKKKKRPIIGLGTLILIIFMIFFVDFKSFINKVIIIGLIGAIIFGLLYTIAFLFRSYKLKLIFKGLNCNIKYTTSYFSIGACFLINDVSPGKLGDFAKMALIKDQESMQLSDSVCGITIERVLDLFLLFIISCFSIFYLYLNDFRYTKSIMVFGQSMEIYLIMGAILLILILIGLITLIYKTEFLLGIIKRISPKLANYLNRFILNFKSGIIKFRHNKKGFAYIIFIGILTWIIDAGLIIIFFYSLGYHLNVILLILAIILSYFCKTFPITPGGWGISENIGAFFIFLFYPQIPFIELLAIFIIDHLFRSVYIFFYGGFSVFHYNFKIKEIEKIDKTI